MISDIRDLPKACQTCQRVRVRGWDWWWCAELSWFHESRSFCMHCNCSSQRLLAEFSVVLFNPEQCRLHCKQNLQRHTTRWSMLQLLLVLTRMRFLWVVERLCLAHITTLQNIHHLSVFPPLTSSNLRNFFWQGVSNPHRNCWNGWFPTIWARVDSLANPRETGSHRRGNGWQTAPQKTPCLCQVYPHLLISKALWNALEIWSVSFWEQRAKQETLFLLV